MKLKTVCLLSMAIALLPGAGLSAADQTRVDLSKLPVGPMKFYGQVQVETRSSGQSLWVMIEARKGGVLAPGGSMTVGGYPVPSASTAYSKHFKGTSFHAGDPVAISFTAPWPGLPAYSATLALPPMIQVSAPREGSHVASSPGGNLEVRWTGGIPPYRMDIMKAAQGSAVIVSLRDLPSGRADIPFASLTPGVEYKFIINDASLYYAFAPAVDPATRVYLRQIIWTHFFLD